MKIAETRVSFSRIVGKCENRQIIQFATKWSPSRRLCGHHIRNSKRPLDIPGFLRWFWKCISFRLHKRFLLWFCLPRCHRFWGWGSCTMPKIHFHRVVGVCKIWLKGAEFVKTKRSSQSVTAASHNEDFCNSHSAGILVLSSKTNRSICLWVERCLLRTHTGFRSGLTKDMSGWWNGLLPGSLLKPWWTLLLDLIVSVSDVCSHSPERSAQLLSQEHQTAWWGSVFLPEDTSWAWRVRSGSDGLSSMCSGGTGSQEEEDSRLSISIWGLGFHLVCYDSLLLLPVLLSICGLLSWSVPHFTVWRNPYFSGSWAAATGSNMMSRQPPPRAADWFKGRYISNWLMCSNQELIFLIWKTHGSFTSSLNQTLLWDDVHFEVSVVDMILLTALLGSG